MLGENGWIKTYFFQRGLCESGGSLNAITNRATMPIMFKTASIMWEGGRKYAFPSAPKRAGVNGGDAGAYYLDARPRGATIRKATPR